MSELLFLSITELKNIFKPNFEEELRKLGEDQFRLVRDLSQDEDLGEAGFWFDDNKFSLNDNFALTEDGIRFFYNSYEIAPYALGTTDITISYDSIKNLLISNFQPAEK